jgi:ubiquinone/menaquinone biosynthesis C-methylase UbiE
MAGRVCPPWVGYLLLNPLRRFFENPEKILSPFVHSGMTVLEPGCGMGYFTLPLARLVGSSGKVIAVDIQEKMLTALSRRALKAGLTERIELRLAGARGLPVEDLDAGVDVVVAIHVVHEMPDAEAFFKSILRILRADGKLLMIEPRGHVKADRFEKFMTSAVGSGFAVDSDHSDIGRRKALLTKASEF